MSDIAPFERHEMPTGSECFYRDSDHSYWLQIQQKAGKWTGIQPARLTSPSTVGKMYDLQLADKLSAAAAKAGMEWFERKDRRAQEGQNVHEKVLEALAAGERIPSLADVEEAERGYAQGIMGWWAEVQPESIASEFVVLSGEHGFAGRIDLLAVIDGKRTIVDLKTGFIGEGAYAQLAGYELAALESGYGPVEATALLKVTDEGEHYTLPGLLSPDSFARAVALYREAKALQKVSRDQWKAVAA